MRMRNCWEHNIDFMENETCPLCDEEERNDLAAQMDILKSQCREVQAENDKMKRLLKRCQTPLRFASMHYLDEGLLGQEHKTDRLIDAIKAALKGRP